MIQSEVNHSVFYRHSSTNQCIYLVIYADDIVIPGNDHDGIQHLKPHLFQHFQIEDLGRLNIYLELKLLNQRPEWPSLKGSIHWIF